MLAYQPEIYAKGDGWRTHPGNPSSSNSRLKNIGFIMQLFTNPANSKVQNFACHHCHTTKRISGKTARRAIACPDCGRYMHNMYAGFIPPHPADQDQWQKIELLVKHKFQFEYCQPDTAFSK
jgi:hypothetical protein